MSNYTAGAKFEYKVRDALKAQGAIYVCRSAGSHGPVDLIAFYEKPKPTTVTRIVGRRPVTQLVGGLIGHRVEFVQAKRDGRPNTCGSGVAESSSDVTTWAPRTCVVCGRPIRVSKDSWGCSYAGTGTVYSPSPTAWHLLDPACVPASQDAA